MAPRSLRARITLGLAALALTLAVVSAVCIASLTRLGGAIATILRENQASVIACEDMKDALAREDAAALMASSGRDGVARASLAAQRAAFARAFDREAHNITLPGEGAGVRSIDALYSEYTAAADRVLAQPDVRARAEAYFVELVPRFGRVEAAVTAVLRLNQANMEDADRAAKAMARRSVRIAVTVCAIAALLALWLAWRLPRTVVAPVRALAEAARAVGEGELDVGVGAPGVSELEPLADAFTRMVARLKVYRASSLGELLAAKDLANATVACLFDPVVVFGAHGDILLSNDAAERAFGLRPGTSDELRDAGVDVPAGIASARDGVLATGTVVAPARFREAMRWRDRYFLVRAAPLRAEPHERYARAIVVAQDVTRFRRIDELKSDMVATVSHEFKTPLTSLRMATHLLLEPATGPLNEPQREVVTTARDDTERLRALVDELLDLVRIEAEAGALRRAPVDPARLLNSVAEAHRTIAREKGVAIEITVEHALEPFSLDAEKIAIVLANLVSNAIRHTPSGGRVALSARRRGEALEITVVDTGEGIAERDLAGLLERPGVPQVHVGRHGLGLTIAKEIVLQHGGELVVDSTPARGTSFTLTIPDERG